MRTKYKKNLPEAVIFGRGLREFARQRVIPHISFCGL